MAINPYINVTVVHNNLNGQVQNNPITGSYSIDTNGNQIMWDGVRWVIVSYSNNYSNNYNKYNNYNSNNIFNSHPYNYDTSIGVFEEINKIKKYLGMIEPDNILIEKYPAVKEAWEDYQKEFDNGLATLLPTLKSAIDSYYTVLSLVKIEESNGENI